MKRYRSKTSNVDVKRGDHSSYVERKRTTNYALRKTSHVFGLASGRSEEGRSGEVLGCRAVAILSTGGGGLKRQGGWRSARGRDGALAIGAAQNPLLIGGGLTSVRREGQWPSPAFGGVVHLQTQVRAVRAMRCGLIMDFLSHQFLASPYGTPFSSTCHYTKYALSVESIMTRAE